MDQDLRSRSQSCVRNREVLLGSVVPDLPEASFKHRLVHEYPSPQNNLKI